MADRDIMDKLTYTQGRTDREIIASLLNEYTTRLRDKLIILRHRNRKDRAFFIAVLLCCIAALYLFSSLVEGWILAALIGSIAGLLSSLISPFTLFHRPEDVRRLGVRLEKLIRFASQIEEYSSASSAEKILLDLRLLDAEDVFQEYQRLMGKDQRR